MTAARARRRRVRFGIFGIMCFGVLLVMWLIIGVLKY
jgi:predicted nucleic acid-binding Zn ribbon protein